MVVIEGEFFIFRCKLLFPALLHFSPRTYLVFDFIIADTWVAGAAKTTHEAKVSFSLCNVVN